ncbi:MAG: hypothetical protein PHG40_01615 [Candidatus Omnitrophica bacterium]|nr:hypothetical protein [Candidatus Omnitrophota bacterium]
MKNKLIRILPAICCFLLFACTCFAQDITILYTGSTHAMLYPCNCPKEPDGGIARRATLLKQLTKTYPHALILDSGSFFAGGLSDEYTQNTQLDMQRSAVNLKAMKLMGYDALNIGGDEFNFGREFLEKSMAEAGLAFLSCNIKNMKVSPYIIKEVSGLKIGIIGVSNLSADQKAGGVEFAEAGSAVKEAVKELKGKGIDLVILLSNLGRSQDADLIEDIPGIDVVIDGNEPPNTGRASKVKETLVLVPAWEGRRLGKVILKIKDKKIADYKAEDLRLSDKISDDPAILSVLPRCFSDNNCKKEGLVGECQNPGGLDSRCLFSKADKISLLVVTSKGCLACDTENLVNALKQQFPGLLVSYIYYPGKEAEKIIKDFNIMGLPAYFLDRNVEKEKSFDALKKNMELKGLQYYMIDPRFAGFSFFVNRKEAKGSLDLFISLYDKGTQELLNNIKDFKPVVHFLAIKAKDKFEASHGNAEVEEYLRAVCVQKYYPAYFWDYITCRSGKIDSSWWEDCLKGFDAEKIRSCARSNEGEALLDKNVALNREVEVMFGPTYLMDNKEIFSSKSAPTKEEFKKIFRK